MTRRITRNAIVVRLGTPDKTEGSLNSPVEQEEYGLRFNEKWIYDHLRDDPSGAPTRMVFWHRYDFVGTLVRPGPDSEWVADTTLLNELQNVDDRLETVESHHEPLPPNPHYRPASEVRDAHDLGGYIEGETE
jgi:hypothetical protein